mmetsp:Transcript_15538/g.35585  ORF Transcript_15538/g.35585 Transcript_15538/m.35585 type:complete len:249 (+) Transcript_15538:985-1731(+)
MACLALRTLVIGAAWTVRLEAASRLRHRPGNTTVPSVAGVTVLYGRKGARSCRRLGYWSLRRNQIFRVEAPRVAVAALPTGAVGVLSIGTPLPTFLAGIAPARPAEVLPPRRVLVYSRGRGVILLLLLLLLFHQILYVARQATVAGLPVGTFLAEPTRAVRGDATFVDGGVPARAAEARVGYVVVVDVRVLEFVPMAQLDIARRPAEADMTIGRAGVVRSLGTVLPFVAVVRRVPPRRPTEEVIRVLS